MMNDESVVADVRSTYDSRIVGEKVAYWKFKKGATAHSFMHAFEEFKRSVTKPNITSLVVSVEMDDPWGETIQDLWIKTGEIADYSGIRKWGIYVPETNFKKATIRFLVTGAGKGTRRYQHFISSNEREVVTWAMQ